MFHYHAMLHQCKHALLHIFFLSSVRWIVTTMLVIPGQQLCYIWIFAPNFVLLTPVALRVKWILQKSNGCCICTINFIMLTPSWYIVTDLPDIQALNRRICNHYAESRISHTSYYTTCIPHCRYLMGRGWRLNPNLCAKYRHAISKHAQMTSRIIRK